MITTVCKNRVIKLITPFFIYIPTCSANGHFYIGTTIAASSAQLSNSAPQISYLSGAIITDAYPLNKKSASTAIFSANGGYEFQGEHLKPAISLGIGIYSNLVDYKYQGQLVETAEGDPSTPLYNYKYKINSKRLMAEIQLSWLIAKLSPFLNFGVGSAWTRMNSYKEMETDSIGYPPLLPFQTHSNGQFAYQAGFGIVKVFHLVRTQSDHPQERITLGYRHVNSGSTSFGTRGSDYPYALNTGALKTNEVYLGYTHLFKE